MLKKMNNGPGTSRKYGKPEPKPVRQVKTTEPKKPSSPMVNEVIYNSFGVLNLFSYFPFTMENRICSCGTHPLRQPSGEAIRANWHGA